MTVKVDGKFSKLRPVNAGAPQGSVLGTYIFNVGTDRLEDDFEQDQNTTLYELAEGDLSFLELTPLSQFDQSSPVRPQLASQPLFGLSPVQTIEQDFVLMPTARNVPPTLTNRIEPPGGPNL